MTAAREDLDDQEQEAYEALYGEIVEAKYAEWLEEFGPNYRLIHPFKVDGGRVHAEVMRRMAAAKEAAKD